MAAVGRVAQAQLRHRPALPALRRHDEAEILSLTCPKSLQRLLTRLGEPTDVQGKASARGPPYFASKLLRRRFGEHACQLDMLD